MDWTSLLIMFVVVVVVGIGRFWLLPLALGHLHAERVPGWAYPIVVPILVLLALRFGQGHRMVTSGYYDFGAALGVVTGLICWMAKRERPS